MKFTKAPELTLQPYGASSGTRSLRLTIGPDTEGTTPADTAALDHLKAVKESLSEALYEELLLGQLHLLVTGQEGFDPADASVRQDILDFVTELSKEALDLQVKTLKRETRQLRPPFIEFHTLGLNYTGNEEFFENFNYVVCMPSLSTSDLGAGKNKEDRYHPFALVEISKHKFSTFVFRVKKAEDWAEINQDFLMPQYVAVQKQRIFVVPSQSLGLNNFTAVARNIALENGVRFGVDLEDL
jgi:hypothetical protein